MADNNQKPWWYDPKWLLWLATWIMSIALAYITGTAIPPPPPMPPHEPVPPVVIPPDPPGPQPKPPAEEVNPMGAILKFRLGSTGCTAANLGRRKEEKALYALCAAHCVSRVGARGTVGFKSGESVPFSVVAIDRGSDCSILRLETDRVFPVARIAAELPPEGTAIWHAGYGVNRPGNVEKGTVLYREDERGQTGMRLSVSSGDSGGPIYREDTGEIISTVCCYGSGRTYGASVPSIRRLLEQVRVIRSDESLLWRQLYLPRGQAEQ